MTIPATCPDFVSHPHLIEGRNCYTCVESLCSEEQGTSAIAEALIALGIPADVHQTGGFTMCVYIKTGEESYIYASNEGFSFYKDAECEGWSSVYFAESETTPEQKAKAIQITMKTANLEAKENTICGICFAYEKDHQCPELWSCGACGEICDPEAGTIENSNGNGFYGEFIHKPELCPAQDEI